MLVQCSEQKNEMGMFAVAYDFIENGQPAFIKLMQIPSEHRINAFVYKDAQKCITTLSALIMIALKHYEIDISVSTSIAFNIVQECKSDNLSLQDIVVFLQRINSGAYGDFYGKKITPIMLMSKLQSYLDDRHEEITKYRDKEHHNQQVQLELNRESSEEIKSIDGVGAAINELKNNLKFK